MRWYRNEDKLEEDKSAVQNLSLLIFSLLMPNRVNSNLPYWRNFSYLTSLFSCWETLILVVLLCLDFIHWLGSVCWIRILFIGLPFSRSHNIYNISILVDVNFSIDLPMSAPCKQKLFCYPESITIFLKLNMYLFSYW